MRLPVKFNTEFFAQENKRLRVVFYICAQAGGLRVDRVLPNLSCRSVARDFMALNKWAIKTDPEFTGRKAFIKAAWNNRPVGGSVVII